MSAEELKTINDLLRAVDAGNRPGSWDERRAAMEATTSIFPLAAGVELTDFKINGCDAEWQAREGVREDAVLLYLHGGGYAVGSITTHRPLTTEVAAGFNGRVLSLGYRLAPEHPCPAAIDDALAAYRYLIEDEGVPAGNIVIAGDSAGGGLTIAALVAIRDAGLPTPAGGWVLSPWADLTVSSGTMTSKAADDLMITAESLKEYAAAYAPGGDVADPRATVLKASLKGLPPLLIQVGTAERLLDDAIALAGRASADDVAVTLETWPGQPHVFQIFAAMMGEARAAIAGATNWANARLI
jgi:acetyl esterase/lipase